MARRELLFSERVIALNLGRASVCWPSLSICLCILRRRRGSRARRWRRRRRRASSWRRRRRSSMRSRRGCGTAPPAPPSWRSALIFKPQIRTLCLLRTHASAAHLAHATAMDIVGAWQDSGLLWQLNKLSSCQAVVQVGHRALRHGVSCNSGVLLCRQGAIQQRMLQMLTGGQSMPPASLAEAAAADVAAAAAQQQQQQSQQHPQQHSQQQLQVCC